ncbi:DUF2726 domain-containing protein [Vibrio sp. NTOU-M3]|uniref:DUF2726 domain-containing protein n=1 Tax=Vibrio sp. NTOU-M3 TaxID=3234954 RepID=UPI00349F44CC
MFELLIIFGCIYFIYSKLSTKSDCRPKQPPNLKVVTKYSETFYERSSLAAKRSKQVEPIPIPLQTEPLSPAHKRSEYLTTNNERRFHAALKQAVPADYCIHCQVSLMALVQPVDRKHNSRTWAKRMDFVITDSDTRIVAVIELDDRTHNWESRKKRDAYVNDVLSKHHRLVRFQSQRTYDPEHIRHVLFEPEQQSVQV